MKIEKDTVHTWNHRVIRHKADKEINSITEEYLAIHEVHYDNGVPTSVTVNPITVGGENTDEIKWTLEKMLLCLEKPILDMEYFDNLAKNAKENDDSDDSNGIDVTVDLGGC